MSYIDTIKKRRSIYHLSDKLPVPAEELASLVKDIVTESPSAFNMQSAKTVLLLGDGHKKLWDITEETLRKIVPAENFAPTANKMSMFRNAAGTVLLYEDEDIVDSFKARFPAYANNFSTFASHGNANVQINLWNAFAELGIGANLQHYNPLIDEEVARTWGIPAGWKLVAQLVFGAPLAYPEAKEKVPAEERVRIYNA